MCWFCLSCSRCHFSMTVKLILKRLAISQKAFQVLYFLFCKLVMRHFSLRKRSNVWPVSWMSVVTFHTAPGKWWAFLLCSPVKWHVWNGSVISHDMTLYKLYIVLVFLVHKVHVSIFCVPSVPSIHVYSWRGHTQETIRIITDNRLLRQQNRTSVSRSRRLSLQCTENVVQWHPDSNDTRMSDKVLLVER